MLTTKFLIYLTSIYLCHVKRKTKTMIEDVNLSEPFQTTEDVRRVFGISKPTEIAWRKKGILPKPVVLGRRVYYKKSELLQLR